MRTVTTGADIVLPLEAYEMTGVQQNNFEKAAALLAHDCMKTFGFNFMETDVGNADTSIPVNSGYYGVIDPAEAAKWGYHPPAYMADDKKPGAPMTPDEAMVYGGKGAGAINGKTIPQGGCLGQARHQLGQSGDANVVNNKITTLALGINGQAQASPRSQAAMKAWSACMQKSGFVYSDMWKANNDVRWSGPTPSQLEIKTAEADVACKTSTKLPSILLAVESGMQQAEVEKEPQLFQDMRKYLDAEMRNVNTVLAGGKIG